MKILLQEKEVMSLEQHPCDLTLKCLEGTLWVTCQGDLNDHILTQGMTYRQKGKGKVAVTALTEGRLCLLDPSAKELIAPAISFLPT